MNETYHPDVRLDTSSGRPGWLTPIVVIGLATAANALILGLAREIHGSLPVASMSGDDRSIGFGAVIATTLIAGFLAWGLFALHRRFTPRAAAVWTVIAGVVLALSLIGPLTNGVDSYSKTTLACLHLSAGAILMSWLPRTRR